MNEFDSFENPHIFKEKEKNNIIATMYVTNNNKLILSEWWKFILSKVKTKEISLKTE